MTKFIAWFKDGASKHYDTDEEIYALCGNPTQMSWVFAFVQSAQLRLPGAGRRRAVFVTFVAFGILNFLRAKVPFRAVFPENP